MKILSKANIEKHIRKYKIIMIRIIRMSNYRKNGIKGIKYIKHINSFYKKSGSIIIKTLALLHVLAMDIVAVMH